VARTPSLESRRVRKSSAPGLSLSRASASGFQPLTRRLSAFGLYFPLLRPMLFRGVGRSPVIAKLEASYNSARCVDILHVRSGRDFWNRLSKADATHPYVATFNKLKISLCVFFFFLYLIQESSPVRSLSKVIIRKATLLSLSL
jgi:hypothetical protein